MISTRVLVCLICATTGLLSGCATSTLPPALSRVQAQRLREIPLPLSVGVASNDFSSDQGLTEALRDSRVFKHVAPLESYRRPPDLLATVERHVSGATTAPFAAILTGG